MEQQIASKVASLEHQHRGEEKGRQPGEARRRRTPSERSTVEVKGAGGILILGGLLVTAAVAAGVTILSRRAAQAKRPPASKKEKVEGSNANDNKIDGSAGIQQEEEPKNSSFETKEHRNVRELGWKQLDEKILELQNGTGKKEIDKQASLGEAEHGMINEEEFETSKRGCECVHDRDEKVSPFLEEESKEFQFEMAECRSNASRPLGPFTFKEIVEQQKVEEARPQMDVSEQQTAQVIDEHEILIVESEDKVNQHQTELIEEHVEEMEETEAASPEGNEENIEKEAEESPEGEKDEEAIEEKKEPESSVEGEDDGSFSNQAQPHIKETEETDENAHPESLAEEGGGSNNNQTQTNTADKEVEKMDNEKQEPEPFPVSSAEESNEEKILLHEVESKASSDYLISSGEVKVKVHVKKAEEKQQKSIAERENTLDNIIPANKAEEKEEDKMQQQFTATIREKAPMFENLLMNIPDRLLVVLLVISLTMVLLHYVKPFSQENSQGI